MPARIARLCLGALGKCVLDGIIKFMEDAPPKNGHAMATPTLDLYSHVLPTMQEAASQKLEQMLFSKKAAQS
jgi:hypothetical protein